VPIALPWCADLLYFNEIPDVETETLADFLGDRHPLALPRFTDRYRNPPPFNCGII
jgi:hypothetical protein